MEIYLISNNLMENNLKYDSLDDLEIKKLSRPLSIEGENLAKSISLVKDINDVHFIYSSLYSSALDTAKYLAERINKKIIVNQNLNDQKIGNLEHRSLKDILFMQNHDFNIKLENGESLSEVGDRINNAIKKIIQLKGGKVAIFTHKRAILSFLIKYCKSNYTLDDDLVLEYNDEIIYNEEEKDYYIYKIKVTFDEIKEIIPIEF